MVSFWAVATALTRHLNSSEPGTLRRSKRGSKGALEGRHHLKTARRVQKGC